MQHESVEYYYVYAADRGGKAVNKHGGVLTRQLTQTHIDTSTPLRDLLTDTQIRESVEPVVWSRGGASRLSLRCAQRS